MQFRDTLVNMLGVCLRTPCVGIVMQLNLLYIHIHFMVILVLFGYCPIQLCVREDGMLLSGVVMFFITQHCFNMQSHFLPSSLSNKSVKKISTHCRAGLIDVFYTCSTGAWLPSAKSGLD